MRGSCNTDSSSSPVLQNQFQSILIGAQMKKNKIGTLISDQSLLPAAFLASSPGKRGCYRQRQTTGGGGWCKPLTSCSLLSGSLYFPENLLA